MINTLNKQLTITATSVVTANTPTGNVEVPINYMQATIQSDGRLSINQAIQNDKVFFENLEDASKDYAAFYNHVIGIAKESTNETVESTEKTE